MEDGAVKDITGMAFIFAAKKRHTDTIYMIAPIGGTIDDAIKGKFSVTLTMPSEPFAGLYSVVMEGAAGNRTVLTRPGGEGIRVIEGLVDQEG
jgi:hypothetical protein